MAAASAPAKPQTRVFTHDNFLNLPNSMDFQGLANYAPDRRLLFNKFPVFPDKSEHINYRRPEGRGI